MSDFIQEYFETIFIGEPLPDGFQSKFAIISAYSPTGTLWTEARNQLADQRLVARLQRWRPHRITGRSPDGNHVEPSWAVPCSKRTARQIASEFHQDAFFWVEDDELQIVDSSRSRPTEAAGSFKGKFIVEVSANATRIALSRH